MSDIKKKIEEIVGPILDENKDLEGRLNAALAKIEYLDEALSKQGQLKAENYNKYLDARNNLEYYRNRVLDQAAKIEKQAVLIGENHNKYLQVKNNLEYYKSEITEHLEKIAEQDVLMGKQRDEISELKMQAAKAAKAVEMKEKLIEAYRDRLESLEGNINCMRSTLKRFEPKEEGELIKHNILLALKSSLEASEGKPVGMRALLKVNGYLLNQSVKNLDLAAKELFDEGLVCIYDDGDDRYTTFSMANTKNNLEKDIDLLIDTIGQGGVKHVSWSWIIKRQPLISKWDWEHAGRIISLAEERNLARVVQVGVYGTCYFIAVG